MNLLLFKESNDGDLIPVLPRTRPSLPLSGTAVGRWQKLRESLSQAYENLKDRLSHEERVCSELRKVETLIVTHPEELSTAESEKKLRKFLKLGYSRHRAWFWIDLILALLGISLAWVPGPNVFFFYPAARALSHYLAKNGARHARAIEWSYETEPLIDEIERTAAAGGEIGEKVQTLEERYNIDNLLKQLRTLKTG